MAKDELHVDAYRRLHELTLKACEVCPHLGKPYGCCEPDACEQAAYDAFELAGIVLTGPFISDKGCMLPPHLRPRCTRFTCDMTWKGNRPAWADQYDRIVEEIDNG